MLDTSSFVEGLLLGLGLFTSVGPKDAFVIRRSITGQHLLLVVMVCGGSDAVLIALGTGGLAALLTRNPIILTVSLWGGIAYLVCHGLLALRAAIRGKHEAATADIKHRYSFMQTLLATTAVSLLNPYAWVDTVLVLGAINGGKSADARWPFALGAVAASFSWFLILTYISYSCRWLFSRGIAWRTLDGFVAVMMLGIAARLATSNL
jgi:L-lysine exporter family protein LysE/ArgO